MSQKPPEELPRRADAALYRAKEAGRDRVMAATVHGRT
jgi:PleD family two-component response regulator